MSTKTKEAEYAMGAGRPEAAPARLTGRTQDEIVAAVGAQRQIVADLTKDLPRSANESSKAAARFELPDGR